MQDLNDADWAAVVHGAHEPSRTEWVKWLASSGLAPPPNARVELQRAGRSLHDEDSRVPLVQADVAIHAGQGRPTRLRWGPRLGSATLDDSAPRCVVLLTDDGVRRLPEGLATFGIVVLIFLMRRVGLHHLHAASLEDPAGRGVLLVGPGGSGKSTTAARLARQGWRLGGDDAVFLERRGGGIVAHPFKAPLAVRPAGRAIAALGPGRRDDRRGKDLYGLADFGVPLVGPVTPRLVAFPRVDGVVTTIEPLARARALELLLLDSVWVFTESAFADDHLSILRDLAGQVQCVRIALGSEVPDLTSRFAEDFDARSISPSS